MIKYRNEKMNNYKCAFHTTENQKNKLIKLQPVALVSILFMAACTIKSVAFVGTDIVGEH